MYSRKNRLTGTPWQRWASERNSWHRTATDLLLQGRETNILPVRLKTAVIDLATDATLRIVENPAGIPVVEINGISSGDK